MDFTRMLRLPPAFGQRYGSILPENAKLRINSGKTWDLKVEQMEDGQFCFTRGWENFVKDVGLEMGEFLVFRFVGKSMLDVSVYGTSACEREIPASSFQVEDSDPDEDHVELSKDCKYNVPDVIKNKRSKARNDGRASKSDQSLGESNPLYFEILLKSHHVTRVTLPLKLWMAAGLMGKPTVGLEYHPNHRCQSVVLVQRANRVEMAAGWRAFRGENGLFYGKTYSMEFKPSKNVIQVKEVKTKK